MSANTLNVSRKHKVQSSKLTFSLEQAAVHFRETYEHGERGVKYEALMYSGEALNVIPLSISPCQRKIFVS